MNDMDKLIKKLPTDIMDIIFSFYTGWHPYYVHCIDQIKDINESFCFRGGFIIHGGHVSLPFYKFILVKNKMKYNLNVRKDIDIDDLINWKTTKLI